MVVAPGLPGRATDEGVLQYVLVWLRVPGVVVQVRGRAAEPVAVICRLCGKGGWVSVWV